MVLKEKKNKYKKSELLHLPVIISFIIIKSIRANFFYIFIERQFKNKRQYLTHTRYCNRDFLERFFFFPTESFWRDFNIPMNIILSVA